MPCPPNFLIWDRHTNTHTYNRLTRYWSGEPVPEETFTNSHPWGRRRRIRTDNKVHYVAAYPHYGSLSQRGLLDPIKPAYQQSRSDVIIIIIYVINMPITYQKLRQLDCGRGRGVVGRGMYWEMTLALQSWTKPWQDVTANVDVKKVLCVLLFLWWFDVF